MPESKELASGDRWMVVQDGSHTLLLLKSVYGTIEVKTRTMIGAELIEAIATTYNELKAQGPLPETVGANV